VEGFKSMAGAEIDDIKEWLAEVATSNPFERLRSFRAENPEAPIPDDLVFAALVSPIVNEDADSISFDKVLAEQIDELIAEDENAKGGGSYKVWRPEAFARIDDLTTNGVMSVENAIDKVLDELAERGAHDYRDNLARSYHRHTAKTLIDQIGTAIANNDQDTAVERLNELRRRHNTFGRTPIF
jgi:hypothetical protein